MGRFREVSKNISIPKYAEKKNKERKEICHVLFVTKCSPDFFFLVLHLETVTVGVLALRIAVRMASILIS